MNWTKILTKVSLIGTHFVVPNSSLIGHLSGFLVGTAGMYNGMLVIKNVGKDSFLEKLVGFIGDFLGLPGYEI